MPPKKSLEETTPRTITRNGITEVVDSVGNHVRTLDVDENGTPIKSKYIGGTTEEARESYWKQAPIMRYAVDSIANEYGIDPALLKYRLNHEGYIDSLIRVNNKTRSRAHSNYTTLYNPKHKQNGFMRFGLDHTGTLLQNGKISLKNESYYTEDNDNEKGIPVLSADGVTNADNIGIMAATLQYLQEEAKRIHPGESPKYNSIRANSYYNRGINGTEKLDINTILNKYNYK